MSLARVAGASADKPVRFSVTGAMDAGQPGAGQRAARLAGGAGRTAAAGRPPDGRFAFGFAPDQTKAVAGDGALSRWRRRQPQLHAHGAAV